MQSFRKLRGPLAAVLLLGASSAFAQDAPQQEPQQEPSQSEPMPQEQPATPTESAPHQEATTPTYQPPPASTYSGTYEPATPMAEERPWYETIGYGLSIGGGVDDFVGDAARATTKVGGSWNARLTIGTKQLIAYEASYIGSAQAIDALGLDNSAVLVGNGIQGAVRLNLAHNSMLMPDSQLQPFLYAGAAWRHYDLTNESFNTSDVKNSDDVFELPVGVGLAGYYGGIMGDVRAEYRGAWGNDLLPTRSDANVVVGPLDRWGVTASIGAEF